MEYKNALLLTILLALCFTSRSFAAVEKWQPGPAGDFAFQTTAFMKNRVYQKPDQLSPDASVSGAYGVNRAWDKTHQGAWYIEEQRYGFDTLAAGIAYQRQDLIERAQKIFDWGFRQQRPDGGFNCPDAFHSTSFFVEAVAHAALLLENSPMKVANEKWLAITKPKLHKAALWMMDPKNEVPGKLHNQPYTHRSYLVALALGEAGTWTLDVRLIMRSIQYIRDGIHKQNPAGFNPERGGYDVSYHSFGMYLAVSYYSIVANDAVRKEMKPMIQKGMSWLKDRMRNDGTFDLSGDTRVGGNRTEKMRDGKPKTMSYWSAVRAFYYWGMITQNRELEQLALKSQHASEVAAH